MKALTNKSKSIQILSHVNETFARTTLSQEFIHNEPNSIEIRVLFPIIPSITWSEFRVDVDNKTFVSKVLKKEKAEEKYLDTISSGNSGLLVEKEKDHFYSLVLGNIPPETTIKLVSYFIQIITSSDMSYHFQMMNKFPNFYIGPKKSKGDVEEINAQVFLSTQSRWTRWILPDTQEQAYIVNKIYGNDFKSATINIDMKGPSNISQQNNSIPVLSVLFRTETISLPTLYYQFDPVKNQTSNWINFISSSSGNKIPKFQINERPDENNDIYYTTSYGKNDDYSDPTWFIFLIDQSGSMDGSPIDLVKTSLQYFIHSLPLNSYFQLIGFGSSFKFINQNPLPYCKDSVAKTLTLISTLQANLGGTDWFRPLNEIFINRKQSYDNIKLSKTVFILTDGMVSNKGQVEKIILDNNKEFRVHTFGIGNDFDREWVQKCAENGKGLYNFVTNVQEINGKVISTLAKCVSPYLSDIIIKENNYHKTIVNGGKQNIVYDNDLIQYSFISAGNIWGVNNDVNIELSGKTKNKEIKTMINISKIQEIPEGDILSKWIIHDYLNQNPNLLEEEAVKMALDYKILSKHTSLFAEVEINKEKQKEMVFVEELKKKEVKFQMKYSGFVSNNQRMCSGGFRGACKKAMSNIIEWRNNYQMNSIPNKENTDDFSQLIFNQDVIEGSWGKSKEIKKLTKIPEIGNIWKKIENLEEKIKFTFLVIYYIWHFKREKYNEVQLIINKGYNFWKSKDLSYDELVRRYATIP